MQRRGFWIALFGICFQTTARLLAKDHGNGRGRGREGGSDDDDHGRGSGEHAGYVLREHYALIRRYYEGPRDLPPGLRKKYYRTGTLPPGWQKKMRPFPPELIRVLPPAPRYCERGYIDGVAIVYDRRTRIILDAVDLVSAVAGH